MSEKIGQSIMTGVEGKTLTSDEKDFIQKENIGGVLLFSRNYESPAQLAELVNSIQKLRGEYPLFIAVDQEGGRVQRFKTPFTVVPSMAELGNLDSPKIVFQDSSLMAKEMAACGVNLNFAPVCDVLTNPKNQVVGDRAFSTRVDQVEKFVSSVIRGFQTNHVMACAKHFPGHGSTSKDSHYDLPIVKKDLESLRKEEFRPFIKAIKSRVEMVMMAHLVVDALDEERPASLSHNAYEILRKELKFQKPVITDDMQMKAITEHYGEEDAAVQAYCAGADIVEYRDMEKAKRGLDGLQKAYKMKEISTEMVNRKSKRIQEIKQVYLSKYEPIYIPDIQKAFNVSEHQNLMKEVHEKLESLSS